MWLILLLNASISFHSLRWSLYLHINHENRFHQLNLSLYFDLCSRIYSSEMRICIFFSSKIERLTNWIGKKFDLIWSILKMISAWDWKSSWRIILIFLGVKWKTSLLKYENEKYILSYNRRLFKGFYNTNVDSKLICWKRYNCFSVLISIYATYDLF